MIRFHLDENVDGAIAKGLRTRGIDVTTAAEAKLLSAPDDAQLGFAHAQTRVLVTHDEDFLRLHAGGCLADPHGSVVTSRMKGNCL